MALKQQFAPFVLRDISAHLVWVYHYLSFMIALLDIIAHLEHLAEMSMGVHLERTVLFLIVLVSLNVYPVVEVDIVEFLDLTAQMVQVLVLLDIFALKGQQHQPLLIV